MKSEKIEFFVPGVPASGGSKNPFRNPKTGKIVCVDSCKRNKPWREHVAAIGMNHAEDELIMCPIRLNVDYYMPRPKYHYGTGRNSGLLKKNAPYYASKKPDVTKLIRALEDALTGIIWKDDALICKQSVNKYYSDRPGALVTIKKLV